MIKLSLQNTWAHKRRLIGTFLAIVIGVGFLSGTLVLGDTLRANFDKLFKAGYAGIDVIVRPERDPDATGGDDAGFSVKTLDGSLVDEIREIDGVRAVEPDVQAFGQFVGKDGELLGGQGPPTLAANWGQDSGISPYTLIRGDAPAGPEEVVIDDESAEKGGFEIGDTATLLLGTGPLEVEIVGIAQFGDGTNAVGVTYAFFDEEGTAKYLARAPGQVNSIMVAAVDGVSEEELLARIEPIIGDGNEALTGEAAADEAVEDINADFLSFLTGFLVAFAGIAIFVATFSIYNTFSIIVAQRMRESALMRAIGATRGQVLRATLIEALLIGILASAVGLLAGMGFATGLKGLFSAFGLGLPAGGLTVKTSGIVIGLIVGVIVTLAAAIAPAIRGSRVRPIEALRASAIESGVPRVSRTIAGIVLAAGGLGLMVWAVTSKPDDIIVYAGIGAAVTLLAMLVLGPVVARPVSRLIGAPIAAAGGLPGELSRENAMRNPRRTASTGAALLVGVAIVVLFSVFIASLKELVSDSVDRTFGGDLVISRGVAGPSIPSLPPTLAEEISDLDSVDRAVGYTYGPVIINEEDSWFGAADLPALASLLELDIVEGSPEGFGDDDIAISLDKAEEEGFELGDPIEVKYPDGFTASPKVAMIYRNADIVGSFTLPRTVFVRHSSIQADAIVFVDVADGTTVADARREIRPLTEPLGKPEILNRDEYTELVAGALDQLLAIVIVMLALAIIIAAMGIANTISLSVHERTRELGLLRAVGTTRMQLRRLVRWEAVIVSTFGTVGGIGLGIGLGWVLTRAALADSASEPFAVPVGNMVTTLVLGVVVGVMAAWRPARRAARMEVLDAIDAT